MRAPSVSSLLLAALVAFAPDASAQELDAPLVTDRPDFTESAVAVPAGRVQLEAGATFASADDVDEQEVGEALLRIGVAPRVEVRVGIPSWARVDLDGGSVDGLTNAFLGSKVELTDPGRPTEVALLAGTSVPTGDDDVAVDAWEPEAILAVGWTVPAPWSLGANAGWSWIDRGGERAHQGSASVAVGRELSERLGGFLETFGFVTEGTEGETAFLDGGLTWLVSSDLQLDARLGAGLTDESDDWFAGVGLSHRW